MKAKWFLFSCLSALLAGSFGASAQDIPPVSNPKVVATYCHHCGWIDVEKGETHRSDCPYAHGSSSSSGSSKSSTNWASTPTGMIANTLTSALGQTLSSWISGESKPDFSSWVEDRPTLVNSSSGGSNGNNNVVYDERSGRVGIWDNKSRRWLLQPYYYEDLVLTDMNAIPAQKMVKKQKKWGIINADNWVIVPFEYGSIRSFTAEKAPIILYTGTNREGPCRICIPDDSAKRGYRLLDDEFEDAKTYWPGKEPCVAVKKEGMWGIVGRNGTYTVEPAWEGIVPLGDYMEMPMMFTQIQTGWGLQVGEREILPHEFKNLNIKNGQIIATYKDGKTGVANMEGRFFLPPIFDKIERLTSKVLEGKNFYKVTKDGKSGLYTDDGVLAAAPVYGENTDFEILALASEKQSYSQWLKRKMKELGAKKDEFETTASYKARQEDPELMNQYLAKVLPDPESSFVEWSLEQADSGRSKHTLTMSAYNADKGCFYITDSATPAFRAYPLQIPLEKAAAFKKEMTAEGKLQEVLKTARYKVYNDRLHLAEMTFSLEDGTTYQLKTL